MKVALVHDWLTGMRGGERVLEALLEIFPQADIYTLVHVPGSVSPAIESRRIHTSFLQRFPAIAKRYRWYLPLMPRAIESFRLGGYDLVVSSSHCVAKGVKPGGAPHLCYLHTPMRYAWDMYGDYFNPERFSRAALFAIGKIMPRLREWDVRTASRVGLYVANSRNVKERAGRIYGVDAEVVYPPVDVDFFTPAEEGGREGYLVVSAFAPYKRVDLAIRAFNELGAPLSVVGSGEDEARLKAMAGPNIRFEGPLSAEGLLERYRRARALVYPGEEDFGIIPVEAQACGTPVIAYGRGGVLETVTPLRDEMTEGCTGVFFDRQDTESLKDAIARFEGAEERFRPEAARRNAERFARPVFMERMSGVVQKFLENAGR
ncbi:MAG: glycosyltransferase [Candidatus Nitrospinota bacterium M3_3B_026]